jgi:hypothetical protein
MLACCLAYPHSRGNSARSSLAWQGAAAEAAARFALRCQCSPPAPTAIARPLWPHTVGCPQTSFFSRLCTLVGSRALGFPNLTAPNKRLPHFRSLSVPSTLPSSPFCPRQYLPRQYPEAVVQQEAASPPPPLPWSRLVRPFDLRYPAPLVSLRRAAPAMPAQLAASVSSGPSAAPPSWRSPSSRGACGLISSD